MVLSSPIPRHEQHRDIGANSVMASAASIALAAHIAFEPSPERRGADLVVVLQEVAEAVG